MESEEAAVGGDKLTHGRRTLLIAGVDEAGRGPLAGPVVAAAVILPIDKPLLEVKDSKLLSEKQREALFCYITENALAVALGEATVEEIDEINILQASLLAMTRAVRALSLLPNQVWVDGNQCPKIPECTVQSFVGGDREIPLISAASIIAKVTRDREMKRCDALYPAYSFAIHKGYPTARHLQALKTFGVSPIHRRSFRPVRAILGELEISNG